MRWYPLSATGAEEDIVNRISPMLGNYLISFASDLLLQVWMLNHRPRHIDEVSMV